MLVQIAPPFAESGKLNFPCGVMNDNEKITDSIVREVKGEAAIECAILVKVATFTTADGIDKINIYHASCVSGEIIIQKSEIIQARWFSTRAALKLNLVFNVLDYIAILNF